MKITKNDFRAKVTEKKRKLFILKPNGFERRGFKFFLTWMMLFSIFMHAQGIEVETGGSPIYCGSVVTLVAPEGTTNSFEWKSSGGILLRELGASGNGFSVVNISNSNKVEAIINGRGKVTVQCSSCTPVPDPHKLEISPDQKVFNPEVSVDFGNIHQPNGIQTEYPWICVKNDGSIQTITITNEEKFEIFWSVTGGALKFDEDYGFEGGKWVAKVMIKTTGDEAGKGFVRAYVADSCGNFDCSRGNSVVNWEILKDVLPDEILGVTCLRDNNLNSSESTVYSVPDDIAGNAVFRWELVDENDGVVEGDDPRFGIESKVLYGNGATVTYKNGYTPSQVGNFKLRVYNECNSDFFERKITVSPEAPSAEYETYCVSEDIGTTKLLRVNNPKQDQNYLWTIQGDNDWTILANDTGSEVTVTFNDSDSGIIVVKTANNNDLDCTSESAFVHINRSGGEVSVVGPDCVLRDSFDAFSFTASPFGLFDWEISPELPVDWELTNRGNVLTVTPPSGGVNVSGKYTVMATLQGCSVGNVSSFDFEIGPAKPIIIGEVCVVNGVDYEYEVSSEAAEYADVTITTATGNVSSSRIILPETINYLATSEDFDISVTTYSSDNCASLSTVLKVKAQPVIENIVADNLCISFGETPTVTFRAVDSGNVTGYQWLYPVQWTKLAGGGQGDDFVTLELDSSTPGQVCLIPSNNGCNGDQFCLDVPRNQLDISVVKEELFPGSGIYKITATANIPLETTWRRGLSRNDVNECGGTIMAGATSDPITSSFQYFIPTQEHNPYMSVKFKNPETGCERCIIIESGKENPVVSGRIERAVRSERVSRKNKKANFKFKISSNPVRDVLDVSVPKTLDVRGMVLLDANGKLILDNRSASNEERIDVSSYAKGMYFLFVLTNQGSRSKKVIVK